LLPLLNSYFSCLSGAIGITGQAHVRLPRFDFWLDKITEKGQDRALP